MNKEAKHTETVLFIDDVPPELKARFKAACARMGLTMKGEIIRLMEEFASKYERSRAISATKG